MVFKTRHFVPLSTLKLVYYSLFHSNIQYSTINWGRAAKSYLYNLKILQNKILRSILFCPSRSPTNLLYLKLKVLKLDDMLNMEIAKFVFKFKNQLLPDFFNNYTKLDNVHNYNIRHNYNIIITISVSVARPVSRPSFCDIGLGLGCSGMILVSYPCGLDLEAKNWSRDHVKIESSK